MPSFIEDAAREISRGATDVAEAIGDAADEGSRAVIREGVRAVRRGAAPALVGTLLLGPLGGFGGAALGQFRGRDRRGRGDKGGDKGLTGGRSPGLRPGARPMPMPVLPLGHPGYGRDGYCGCSIDPKTGDSVGEGEAFTYSARLQFTGAQAVSTDLGDFFTTAASTDLTTNNQFPFDFEVDEATLIMGVTFSTAVAATGTELASLLSLKLIERKYNSQEHYQLSVVELAPTIYYNGVNGTPTATAPASSATIYQIQPENIYAPWGRRYVTNQQWQLALRTPRAFTVPANATFDLNLQLRGRRI